MTLGLPVVIVGNGQVAELALARLQRDSSHQVVGFAVDRAYLTAPEMLGLPIVAFEDIVQHYPPSSHRLVVAIGPIRVNRVRAERFEQAKALGYGFVSLISPRASVWPGVQMGENCTVGDGCVIQPYTRLGDNVHVGSGCIVGHHVELGDHCYLAASVALAGSVCVERYATLGVGAVVRDRVTIGESAVLGAGVVMSGPARAHGVYAPPQPVLLPITSDKLPG